MESRTHFTIGTRKSDLALVQTYLVRDNLQRHYPHFTFEINAMSTTGDKILNQALSKIGEKALFTKELEIALDTKKVDLVVHSLKDLPTTLPPNMLLAAIMERENPNDALVLNEKCKNLTLETLPEGSVIGTSSLRRVAQLRRRYPHLKFTDVRGNLGTRLAKLDDPNGPYSGIVLAVAGLVRLKMDYRISQILPSQDSLHAVSQGALGIECRQDDLETQSLLQPLNHADTRILCMAERELLRTLEGGCTVPIGVNTKLDQNQLWMHGLVASLDGQNVVEVEDSISLEESLSSEERESLAVQLGHAVAEKLIENGADKILAELGHSNQQKK